MSNTRRRRQKKKKKSPSETTRQAKPPFTINVPFALPPLQLSIFTPPHPPTPPPLANHVSHAFCFQCASPRSCLSNNKKKNHEAMTTFSALAPGRSAARLHGNGAETSGGNYKRVVRWPRRKKVPPKKKGRRRGQALRSEAGGEDIRLSQGPDGGDIPGRQRFSGPLHPTRRRRSAQILSRPRFLKWLLCEIKTKKQDE